MTPETLYLFLSITALLVSAVALVQSAQANGALIAHQRHHAALWAAIIENADPAKETPSNGNSDEGEARFSDRDPR